jgi:hypothetical protein
LNRRDALKLALAAGVVSIPALAGGRVLLESNGRPMPDAPIFVANADEDNATAPLLIAYPDNMAPAAWEEILRVEGLPYARSLPLSALDPAALAAAAAVILLPGATTDGQRGLLRDYVEVGGGLIAVAPDAALAALCGLEWLDAATPDGYLCVRSGAPGGAGIAGGALQFHAPLQHYQLREAEAVAHLCSPTGAATTTPAVTLRQLGRGAIAAWCYDLAQSIVLTRQGPPARAGVESDGIDGLRAVDLFAGFIDLDRIDTPQADEQQRLLVNLLNQISLTPLPRLWYFPNDAPSVLVATGDSHNNPASAVDTVLRIVEQWGGTMSIYYTPPPTDTVRRAVRRVRAWLDEQPVTGDLLPPTDVVTPYHAAVWRARGHEFALHPYVEEGLEAGWARYWQQFTGLGFGAFDTTRTHRVLWHGWTDTAHVQASYAVRMNTDYYHIGPTFQRPDGGWAFGFFTGSGLPMRFVDAEGRLIDAWQQTTHLVDEQVLAMPWESNFVGSTPEEAIEIVDAQLARAVSGAYAALGAQFHFDPFAVPGVWTAGAGRYLEGVLAHSQARGLPIVAATHWLAFTQARAAARFREMRFDAAAGDFTCTVQVDQSASGLTLLLPVQKGALHLAVLQANRKQIAFTTRKVGATLYAVVRLDGVETAVEARYATE